MRMAGSEIIGVVEGVPITMPELVAAHRRGDHLVNGGLEQGAFWATGIQARPPAFGIEHSLRVLNDLKNAALNSPEAMLVLREALTPQQGGSARSSYPGT